MVPADGSAAKVQVLQLRVETSRQVMSRISRLCGELAEASMRLQILLDNIAEDLRGLEGGK